MGNFQSICSILLGSRTAGEEDGGSMAYPNLQNKYKSYRDSSERSVDMLLFFSSIYKATKAILQKLCVVFNYLRPRKAANPPPNAPREPLLLPPPQTCSSSHSILEDSLSGLSGAIAIDDEEAQCENVGHVSRCQIYENVEMNSTREEEREAKDQAKKQVKRSIVEKRIKHYSSRHKTLLVGEGDFSFSACLALAFGSAANIVATSLDSQAFLKKNYGYAMSNIAELRRREGTVMHGIDATKMVNHELLGPLKFDRIIFNFPYAGIFNRSVPTETKLRRHRKLVSKFLMNARNMLSENGEIHISHKTNNFHVDFNVESIASSHGLRLVEAVKFKLGDYPGYNTKYGFGGDANFDCYPSKTFKFSLKLN